MKTPVNPPAFPVICAHYPSGDVMSEPGMTLRDYFAAAAMNGMFASDTPTWNNPDLADRARGAYETADAMLAQREKARS